MPKRNCRQFVIACTLLSPETCSATWLDSYLEFFASPFLRIVLSFLAFSLSFSWRCRSLFLSASYDANQRLEKGTKIEPKDSNFRQDDVSQELNGNCFVRRSSHRTKESGTLTAAAPVLFLVVVFSFKHRRNKSVADGFDNV